MLGLLQDSDLANAMGWQHSVYQGTYTASLDSFKKQTCLNPSETNQLLPHQSHRLYPPLTSPRVCLL